MFRYKCLNPIADIGLNRFDGHYVQTDDIKEADAVLVRSANMHDLELSSDLQAIARAGAGVNNIPVDKCTEKGIVVFNTPGANANGVKELVIAGMLLAARDIVGGVNWVNSVEDVTDIAKMAETEKKNFAGSEINHKKLGIIGLGAIGVLVANAAKNLGMEVYGYDPYISVDAAWNLSRDIKHINDVEMIYKECDYITIHVPLLEGTKKMINESAISMMKENVVLLNFARDLLVDEVAMVKALKAGRVKKYVTDFPNPITAKEKNTLVIPHLGASTEESEDNCAKMAVKEVINYLEHGNIRNSVNFPSCDMGYCQWPCRVAIIHQNIKNMIRQFSEILGEADINISDMTNKSKQNIAYTMFDLETPLPAEILNKLKNIEGVLKIRIIK